MCAENVIDMPTLDLSLATPNKKKLEEKEECYY
jgi:hypothetical protein